MKMSFVSKFENQDIFIKAFIQEDGHPFPKPTRRIFGKTLTWSLHSLPPAGTKTDFKSQVYSSSSLPLSFSFPQVGSAGRAGEHRGAREGQRKSVPDCEVSDAKPA